jgi:hypothetical protein
MGVRGQPHTHAAFHPRRKDAGTSWTEGWEGPRADLDAEARGEIILPLPGIELR